MTSDNLKCPKCDRQMEAGFMLDRKLADRGRPLLWVEAAQIGLTTNADPSDAGQFAVDAYRCLGCGFVELYAGMGDEDV